jgi:di/tricarboxylate transporter
MNTIYEALRPAEPYLGLGLLVLMLLGFVRERYPASVIAVAGACSFLALGALSTRELLLAIGNPAPVTIAAMFVLSGALARTGVIDAVARRLEQLASRSAVLAAVALFVLVIAASAFVNNTPVVLVLIPVVLRIAAATGYPSPWMLMALSFLSILGGTCTMIGTSTNLLVDGIAQDAGLVPFGLFEIAPVGLVTAAVGVLSLALLAPLVRRAPACEPYASPLATQEAYRGTRAPIALGVLSAVVLLAAADAAPIVALALSGVAIVLLTRCIDAKEAWASIDAEVLVVIFSMLIVGMGLREAGSVRLIVASVEPLLLNAGPFVLLLGIYAVTSALTEAVTNNAVAALMTPLVIELAGELGRDPRPLVVAVMFAASASFATPIGYQTNTLIYGTGAFRFADFLRIGIPLNIIVGLATCAALLRVY